MPRTLRSAFLDALRDRRNEPAMNGDSMRAQVMAALQDGRLYDLLPFAGQTVGLIKEVTPAAEIVRNIAEEAERVLQKAGVEGAAAT